MPTNLNHLDKKQLSNLVSSLQDAILAHHEWFSSLMAMLAMSTNNAPNEFCHHQAHQYCQFGKWLESTVVVQRISSPLLIEIESKHEQLHKAAHKLLTNQNTPFDFNGKTWITYKQLWHNFNHLLLSLFEKVSEFQSQFDPLTGLSNRGKLMNVLAIEFARSARNNTDLILCVCDLDYFKSVNDTYGHIAGDMVLMEVAKQLEKNIRNYDIAARLGGEEFTLVFPETSREDAEQTVDRIRQAIEGLTFNYQEQNFQITMSFGLTNAAVACSVEHALDTADQAMFKAKNSGRNTIKYIES